jgi:osmotically-inducible protein OsmY
LRRSDLEIRRDIEAELQWNPSIDDKKIGVTVNAGVVTLTGEVDHRAGRCAAEDVAKRITGVRTIANEIQVKLAREGVRSDPEIVLAVAEALRWHVVTAGLNITQIVQNAWITLRGKVPFRLQRPVAEHVLRPIAGVHMIIDDLEVGRHRKAIP